MGDKITHTSAKLSLGKNDKFTAFASAILNRFIVIGAHTARHCPRCSIISMERKDAPTTKITSESVWYCDICKLGVTDRRMRELCVGAEQRITVRELNETGGMDKDKGQGRRPLALSADKYALYPAVVAALSARYTVACKVSGSGEPDELSLDEVHRPRRMLSGMVEWGTAAFMRWDRLAHPPVVAGHLALVTVHGEPLISHMRLSRVGETQWQCQDCGEAADIDALRWSPCRVSTTDVCGEYPLPERRWV